MLDRVTVLNAVLTAACLAPEGFDIADSPPDVFQAVVKRDVAKWIKVVKEANVKAIQ